MKKLLGIVVLGLLLIINA